MSRGASVARNAPGAAPPLWTVSLEVPKSAGGAFDDAFAAIGEAYTCFNSGADEQSWRFEVLVAGQQPARAALERLVARAARRAGIPRPEIRIERLAARDWLADNRTRFPPVFVGRFFVYGSYFTGQVPGGHIPLVLDAGLAFGSGTHESTRGCLLALDALAKRGRARRPLDLGTGSGILALAMAKLWRAGVAAADIDPIAAEVAAANARRNGVARWVRPQVSDGLARRALKRRAPYDLIVANILARPLERLAPALTRASTRRATIVLSGILIEQAVGVIAAYRAQGWALARRIELGLWTTLVLRRGSVRT
jgi:ribosomal protein L11 methyltransferase